MPLFGRVFFKDIAGAEISNTSSGCLSNKRPPHSVWFAQHHVTTQCVVCQAPHVHSVCGLIIFLNIYTFSLPGVVDLEPWADSALEEIVNIQVGHPTVINLPPINSLPVPAKSYTKWYRATTSGSSITQLVNDGDETEHVTNKLQLVVLDAPKWSSGWSYQAEFINYFLPEGQVATRSKIFRLNITNPGRL